MKLVPLAAALVLLPLVAMTPAASAVCEGPVCVPTPCASPAVACLVAYCEEHFATCQLLCQDDMCPPP